jgi:hypothetical protein
MGTEAATFTELMKSARAIEMRQMFFWRIISFDTMISVAPFAPIDSSSLVPWRRRALWDMFGMHLADVPLEIVFTDRRRAVRTGYEWVDLLEFRRVLLSEMLFIFFLPDRCAAEVAPYKVLFEDMLVELCLALAGREALGAGKFSKRFHVPWW